MFDTNISLLMTVPGFGRTHHREEFSEKHLIVCRGTINREDLTLSFLDILRTGAKY